MKNKELKITNHYGVIPQLKYFQSEVFELNEAIIDKELSKENPVQVIIEICNTIYKNKDFKIEHIAEEIADVQVMLNQFKEYYEITDEEIEKIMSTKIDRQIERISNEK